MVFNLYQLTTTYVSSSGMRTDDLKSWYKSSYTPMISIEVPYIRAYLNNVVGTKSYSMLNIRAMKGQVLKKSLDLSRLTLVLKVQNPSKESTTPSVTSTLCYWIFTWAEDSPKSLPDAMCVHAQLFPSRSVKCCALPSSLRLSWNGSVLTIW